jgi:hypothetical protein
LIILVSVLAVSLLGVVSLLAILYFRDRSYLVAIEEAHRASRQDRERVDRLIEAIAHKAEIPVVMPAHSDPDPPIPASGWWDKRHASLSVPVVVSPDLKDRIASKLSELQIKQNRQEN